MPRARRNSRSDGVVEVAVEIAISAGYNQDRQGLRRYLGGLMVDRLLTVDEVAERLGEKPAWVYDRVRSGELPAVHIGSRVRFRPQTIECWRREIRCIRCEEIIGDNPPSTSCK